jgi:tetratricopeptide (TPR) repeat protein
LSRNAHHGCLIVAAKRDDFDGAVLHGWLAFRSSAGDPALEAEALSNIGGVLATARQYRTAQAAFSAALRRRPPARMAVPALGGSVLTSARLGDAAGTRAAYAELLRHAASADHRYEITDALVDAALALQLIGDRMEAERARARAREMAAEGAFHELAFRAEQPLEETEEGAQAPSMPAPLSDETRDICQRVEQLDSADLLQGAHA